MMIKPISMMLHSGEVVNCNEEIQTSQEPPDVELSQTDGSFLDEVIKEGESYVENSLCEQKVEALKRYPPVQAERKSSRLQKRDNTKLGGKRQSPEKEEDFMSGLDSDPNNPFTVLNLITEEDLSCLARDCNIVLGSNSEESIEIFDEMKLEEKLRAAAAEANYREIREAIFSQSYILTGENLALGKTDNSDRGFANEDTYSNRQEGLKDSLKNKKKGKNHLKSCFDPDSKKEVSIQGMLMDDGREDPISSTIISVHGEEMLEQGTGRTQEEQAKEPTQVPVLEGSTNEVSKESKTEGDIENIFEGEKEHDIQGDGKTSVCSQKSGDHTNQKGGSRLERELRRLSCK